MLRRTCLLAAALGLASFTAHAQLQYDAAVTFDLEHAQIAQVNGSTFWLKGGSVDASLILFHKLGVAANVTGVHGLNIQPGIGLDKISYMVGPRYIAYKLPRTQVFAEALFGEAHAFDSVFPANGNTTTSANSFSMQAGGGVDVNLVHGFGVRALEADWVRTSLPNNAQNTQNDFRLAFGISYRR